MNSKLVNSQCQQPPNTSYSCLNNLSCISGSRDSITIYSSDYTVRNNDYTPISFTIERWTTQDGGAPLGRTTKFVSGTSFSFSTPTFGVLPFTTYYFSMSVSFTGLDSPISHPPAGSYKSRSTSGTAPTIMFTNDTLTSSTDINPTSDFTITNGDAGEWSKMILKLSKYNDSDPGSYGWVEEEEVLYRNRANTVTFTNDIFAHLDGVTTTNNNALHVLLEYTNSLIPQTVVRRYVSTTGALSAGVLLKI